MRKIYDLRMNSSNGTGNAWSFLKWPLALCLIEISVVRLANFFFFMPAR